MSKYVENNLNKNENIVKKATLSPIPLVIGIIKFILELVFIYLVFSPVRRMMEFTDTSFFDLIFGIIADDLISFMFFGIMFFILLLAGIHEIKSFFRFFNMELAVTNKRVIGKSGIINTSAVDVPLDKIHSVSVSNGLFGKIFNYGNVVISMSTYETFRYQFISNPDEFKATLMEEIDRYKSAEEMDKKSAATEEN